MKYFIYVFDEETRDKLLAAGLVMFKADPEGGRYVFLNDGAFTFADGTRYVLADTLTF